MYNSNPRAWEAEVKALLKIKVLGQHVLWTENLSKKIRKVSIESQYK